MTQDIIVVGAGIVGLSTAYKLSLAYPDASITVLEKEDRVAPHQTGHNSGVIHSGIYYVPGSYKARNCVDGRHQLVEFCQEHDIAHDVCGKVIVATEEDELPKLDFIFERGLKNEIEGIEKIGPERLKEIEPHCAGIGAIHVPCTGIVDFVGVCEKLKELLEQRNGRVLFGQKVTRVLHDGDELIVRTDSDEHRSGYLINCGGLHCDHIARDSGVKSPIKIVPFRGEYYELKPEVEHFVKGLIYPLPHEDFPFLGVHFTSMALGGVECGPNAVPSFKREGYNKLAFDLWDTIETVNFPGFWKLAFQHWRMGLDEWYRSFSKPAFVKGLQRLIPAIQEEHLEVSPSGVRAMALTPEGEIMDDFYFATDKNEIHVLNAPSPAATAGLAIGDEIVRKAEEHFNLSV